MCIDYGPRIAATDAFEREKKSDHVHVLKVHARMFVEMDRLSLFKSAFACSNVSRRSGWIRRSTKEHENLKQQRGTYH